MDRKECLEAAGKAVLTDRENTYGKPEDNFKMIAYLWGDYLGIEMAPESVAHMMILLKIARIAGGKYNPDNYIDIAGYAACAAEIGAEKLREEPILGESRVKKREKCAHVTVNMGA